jgi:hypothetical protein
VIEGETGIGWDPGALRPLTEGRCGSLRKTIFGNPIYLGALCGCPLQGWWRQRRLSSIVPAVVGCGCARCGARLQTKVQQGRCTDDIARLLPPGAAAMKEKVRRPSFVDGVKRNSQLKKMGLARHVALCAGRCAGSRRRGFAYDSLSVRTTHGAHTLSRRVILPRSGPLWCAHQHTHTHL